MSINVADVESLVETIGAGGDVTFDFGDGNTITVLGVGTADGLLSMGQFNAFIGDVIVS